MKGNYSLYNLFKYPQISILIYNIEKWALNNTIMNLIASLRNQTLNNIEIILTLSKKDFKDYKIFKNLCISDKRITIAHITNGRLYAQYQNKIFLKVLCQS